MTQSLDIFRQLKEYPLWCSGLRTQHCLCGGTGSIPGLVHWVKDLMLLQLWHRSQLQLRFDPGSSNFHVLQGAAKKKEKGGGA